MYVDIQGMFLKLEKDVHIPIPYRESIPTSVIKSSEIDNTQV